MSVLDAFLSTWSNARSTFGDGAPQTGARYDRSDKLTELQNTATSAAPNGRWTGTASEAYGIANGEHGRVLGQIAGLDQRLASEVTASANVVTSGRRDLDAVRKWVLDAASTAPQNQAGERMMLPIVKKGLKDLTDIVERSNGDLNAIGGRLRAIGQGYQALDNQRFGGPNGESTTGDSRKPKIQAIDFREGPAPEDPSPPEPGGGYGSYHYGSPFSTSEAWSQQQIMREIQKNYNKYFTFTGDQPEIVDGAVINLNGPAGPEPVKVTKVTDTSFSFISLPGHHEGAGRVIEFSIVPAAASPVPGRLNWELRVEASGPLSDLSLVPGASWFQQRSMASVCEQSRQPTAHFPSQFRWSDGLEYEDECGRKIGGGGSWHGSRLCLMARRRDRSNCHCSNATHNHRGCSIPWPDSHRLLRSSQPFQKVREALCRAGLPVRACAARGSQHLLPYRFSELTRKNLTMMKPDPTLAATNVEVRDER